METRDQHAFELLRAIETGHAPSKRRLARRDGIALGLTNLLVRRLAKRGFVKIIRVRANRVRYLITPAGLGEVARISRERLRDSVRRYAEARDRVQGRLATLAAEWPNVGPPAEKRIAFYGAGELAEIGYICLQGTDLTLVAVIDPARVEAFFGLPVRRPDALPDVCATVDRIVVMSSDQLDTIKLQLEAFRIPADMLFWI